MLLASLLVALVSIVTRFHDLTKLELLRLCVASVARQQVAGLEQVIVCQNFSDEHLASVEQAVLEVAQHQVRLMNVAGAGDIRSRLLNEAMATINSEWLGFIDFDDVYEDGGLGALLQRFKAAPESTMVGGCVKVRRYNLHGKLVSTKAPYVWGSDKYDLVLDNFLPIHSYLISLEKVDVGSLRFCETLTHLEDYDFLVSLAVRPGFQLTMVDAVVGYHCLREDGSNTSIFCESEKDKIADWHRAANLLKQKYAGLEMCISWAGLYPLVESRFLVRRFHYVTKYSFLRLLGRGFSVAESSKIGRFFVWLPLKILNGSADFVFITAKRLRDGGRL